MDAKTTPVAISAPFWGLQTDCEGAGGVTDASVFKFTGLNNELAVTSTTAGTSTGTPGTFTADDPWLYTLRR
jgi:hypothetical protein